MTAPTTEAPVDQAAKETAAAQAVEKRPTPPDPAHLAAVLRQRLAMKARLDAAEKLFEEVNFRAEYLLDQQYKASKSVKADVTLGGDDDLKFGTVTRVGGQAEAEVTDRTAFTAWVRDTYPEHWNFRIIPARTEVVVDQTFTAAVLAAVDAAGVPQYADPDSGELQEVPGVRIVPKRRRHWRWLFSRPSKRQPLDGRGLAAAAVEAGHLDLDRAIEAPASLSLDPAVSDPWVENAQPAKAEPAAE
ncbi:hypothetical protein SFUL_5542 [Streptomyces microflavus DSM 40593]|uniref:Uncharacterized protein n=1 Tax=Streptomyces microflavus DSM 40593 TaxID=1303692 RepID=N0CXJ5_STRMI|nr:hypothetical protein [Streptomyces microflavus]AGK80430.1 hypothetical protein SFUL_5542 [Streptomyces microflavus DSM 40593]